MNTPLTPAQLHRLRWRSRRGLLENDLLIARFFARHGSSLTQRQAQAFTALMQLDDGELLDTLLRRKALDAALDTPPIRAVLDMFTDLSHHQRKPIHENCRTQSHTDIQ